MTIPHGTSGGPSGEAFRSIQVVTKDVFATHRASLARKFARQATLALSLPDLRVAGRWNLRFALIASENRVLDDFFPTALPKADKV